MTCKIIRFATGTLFDRVTSLRKTQFFQLSHLTITFSGHSHFHSRPARSRGQEVFAPLEFLSSILPKTTHFISRRTTVMNHNPEVWPLGCPTESVKVAPDAGPNANGRMDEGTRLKLDLVHWRVVGWVWPGDSAVRQRGIRRFPHEPPNAWVYMYNRAHVDTEICPYVWEATNGSAEIHLNISLITQRWQRVGPDVRGHCPATLPC